MWLFHKRSFLESCARLFHNANFSEDPLRNLSTKFLRILCTDIPQQNFWGSCVELFHERSFWVRMAWAICPPAEFPRIRWAICSLSEFLRIPCMIIHLAEFLPMESSETLLMEYPVYLWLVHNRSFWGSHAQFVLYRSFWGCRARLFHLQTFWGSRAHAVCPQAEFFFWAGFSKDPVCNYSTSGVSEDPMHNLSSTGVSGDAVHDYSTSRVPEDPAHMQFVHRWSFFFFNNVMCNLSTNGAHVWLFHKWIFWEPCGQFWSCC